MPPADAFTPPPAGPLAPGGAEGAPAPLPVAAVDLGSNSFHMMVAHEADGRLMVLDRLREAVRLAAGLTPDLSLKPEVAKRALDCLSRFGQRLRELPRDRVRVVGTNTLRRLRDAEAFRVAAEAAIGHPIETISGVEEARLVYSGVTHGLGAEHPRRLVVDIGGGSTEVIIGEGATPRLMESVGMGCVVHTERFFADGQITRARFAAARLAARGELEFLQHRYRATGWDQSLGASGTVRGIWRVARAQGWCEDALTREALEKVVGLVLRAGAVARIDFEGLREDRRPVFAGGLAVLAGVFDALRIETLETSEHALREGLLFDLLGRLSHQDVRERAVAGLVNRYGIDAAHARTVRDTAWKLLAACAGPWELAGGPHAQRLGWAARLHEIGLAIAHDAYHRHGEYVLRHADITGFSRTDQAALAALVRVQRGKPAPEAFGAMPASERPAAQRLGVLLRLAVTLHRARVPGALAPFALDAGRKSLRLEFPPGWLEANPLTRADLEQEVAHWAEQGLKLRVD